MVTQEEIDELLSEITIVKQYLFSKDFSTTNKKSRVTRATFILGTPLDIDGRRYRDKLDDSDGQDKYALYFANDIDAILSEHTPSSFESHFINVIWVEE